MTHYDHRFDRPSRRQGLANHAIAEYVIVLAFVAMIGGLTIAEVGGALGSLVHSISIVA